MNKHTLNDPFDCQKGRKMAPSLEPSHTHGKGIKLHMVGLPVYVCENLLFLFVLTRLKIYHFVLSNSE